MVRTNDAKQKLLHRIQCMKEFLGPLNERIDELIAHYAGCCDSSSSSSSSSSSYSSSSSSSSSSYSFSSSSSSGAECDSCLDYPSLLVTVSNSSIMVNGSYIATAIEGPPGFCSYEFEPAWRPESVWFGPVLLEFDIPPFHGLETSSIRAYADYGFGLGTIFSGGPVPYSCFSDLIGSHDNGAFIDADSIYTIGLA